MTIKLYFAENVFSPSGDFVATFFFGVTKCAVLKRLASECTRIILWSSFQDLIRSLVFGLCSLIIPAGYANDPYYFQCPKQPLSSTAPQTEEQTDGGGELYKVESGDDKEEEEEKDEEEDIGGGGWIMGNLRKGAAKLEG